MYILLFLTALPFDAYECARPRSVNLALETVLEFDKDADINLVDRVQNFLSKVKSTIQESRGITDTRRSNTFKFSDFFEESVDILRSYNEIDLKFLLQAVGDEVTSFENCKDDSDNSDFELRRYLNDKILNAKNITGEEIKRKLDYIKQKLNDEDYKRNSFLLKFLNSLFSNSQNEFQIVLNDLQMFRRRNAKSNLNLRSIVKNTIGFVITDYYCGLKKENRQEIKHMLSYFLKNQAKRSRKRKVKDKKPSLRHENVERNKTLLNEIKEKYRQYQQDYLKIKNYYNIKDSWDAKKLIDTKVGIEPNKQEKHDKYVKIDPENIVTKKDKDIQRKIKTDYLTTDYKTDLAFDNVLAISSKEYKKINTLKKRKYKTTRETTTEGNSEVDAFETNVKKQRNVHKIKNVSIKRKKGKKRLKPKKILVEMFTTAIETTDYKKHFLKKLLSKDSNSDNSISKDDIPIWKKYTTKPSYSQFKTFITLYPESIDVFNKETTTEGVRKRFKIKYNNDTTTENIEHITTNAEIDIDIDIDKSAFRPMSFDGNKKLNTHRIKNSPKRKFRCRISKKRSKAIHSLDKNRNQSSETSNVRAASKQESSMETFGSLYSYRNKHKNQVKKLKTYRKSNDKDSLQIASTSLTANVTNTTDKIDSIENSTKDFFSEEYMTSTYGTLAFWSGTERSTFVTPSSTNITKNTPTIITKTLPTSLENKTEKTDLLSTQIVFRSHTINDTIESSPKNSSKTPIHNETTVSSTVKSTTKEHQVNLTTTVETKNIKTVNISTTTVHTTPLDLRRYLENIQIEDLEGEQKTKVEAKIKDDIEKLLATNSAPGFSTKDEIDELEEAFNL